MGFHVTHKTPADLLEMTVYRFTEEAALKGTKGGLKGRECKLRHNYFNFPAFTPTQNGDMLSTLAFPLAGSLDN